MKKGFLTGFTLVEVLLTAFILSIIIAGIFMALNVADITWYSDMGLVDLQQQARLAMDGMARETRQSNPDYITISDAGMRVNFYISGIYNAISYYLLNNQVIREYPANTTKVLANDISSLNFCCLGGADCADCANANVLQIQVESAKAVRNRPLAFSLLEKVRLRNE